MGIIIPLLQGYGDNYIREANAVVHRLGNSKNSLTLSKELECLKT